MCSNFTWTVPDPKCGDFNKGFPYSLGHQRRFKLKSPTMCFCHQYDRFRFACDDDIHGAITFFIEILPFLIWVLGIFNAIVTWPLVILPIHARKFIKIRAKMQFQQVVTELLDLRYVSCCYMTIALPLMNVSDALALNFDKLFYERGIYQHQVDFAFAATAAILMITAHGLALINWVNLLHYASTLDSRVPLWRK